MDSKTRSGLTLLELLVVIAIIGVLIGLLLPAMQRVRSQAAKTQSTNNLRQTMLAVHSFAEVNHGRLPSYFGKRYEFSLYVTVLPYLEQGNIYQGFRSIYPPGHAGTEFTVPQFVGPADPSLTEDVKGTSSYAANATLFSLRGTLGRVSDGLSNTISFSERYGYNCGGAMFIWALDKDVMHLVNTPPGQVRMMKYAVFANEAGGDVHPISAGGATKSSIPGLTFQTSPSISQCDPRIPQSPHAEGMLVALTDGSVRMLAKDISNATFWGAVTPNSSDRLGNDWQ